jgi:uncharacterized protein (DUF2336 family)
VAYKAYRVSSSEFRQFVTRTGSGKQDRLFRAAISAFCSLPRPSRREIAQLDDLTLPLFDAVPSEALRFAAAALSECEYAPPLLVKRLSESAIEVAAPLLVRSRAISDIDLIALIGRHGLPHARAIARRTNLNPAIAALVRALERQTLAAAASNTAVEAMSDGTASSSSAAEETRQKLRAMMLKDQANEPASTAVEGDDAPYPKLRDAALGSNRALFHAALADALGIDISVARKLTEDASSYSPLLTALKALGIDEDKAFLIAAALLLRLFPDPAAIGLFLEHYRLLDPESARRTAESWKGGQRQVVVPIRA